MPNSPQYAIFCDTETSGKEAPMHQIYSFYAVVVDLAANNAIVEEVFFEVAHRPDVVAQPLAVLTNGIVPFRRIGELCLRSSPFTGLSHSLACVSELTFAHGLKDLFSRYSGNSVFIAYNAAFDVDHCRQTLVRNGIPRDFFPGRIFCLYKEIISRIMNQEISPESLHGKALTNEEFVQASIAKGKQHDLHLDFSGAALPANLLVPSLKLTSVCTSLGITVDEHSAHGAAYDVFLAYQLWTKLDHPHHEKRTSETLLWQFFETKAVSQSPITGSLLSMCFYAKETGRTVWKDYIVITAPVPPAWAPTKYNPLYGSAILLPLSVALPGEYSAKLERAATALRSRIGDGLDSPGSLRFSDCNFSHEDLLSLGSSGEGVVEFASFTNHDIPFSIIEIPETSLSASAANALLVVRKNLTVIDVAVRIKTYKRKKDRIARYRHAAPEFWETIDSWHLDEMSTHSPFYNDDVLNIPTLANAYRGEGTSARLQALHALIKEESANQPKKIFGSLWAENMHFAAIDFLIRQDGPAAMASELVAKWHGWNMVTSLRPQFLLHDINFLITAHSALDSKVSLKSHESVAADTALQWRESATENTQDLCRYLDSFLVNGWNYLGLWSDGRYAHLVATTCVVEAISSQALIEKLKNVSQTERVTMGVEGDGALGRSKLLIKQLYGNQIEVLSSIPFPHDSFDPSKRFAPSSLALEKWIQAVLCCSPAQAMVLRGSFSPIAHNFGIQATAELLGLSKDLIACVDDPSQGEVPEGLANLYSRFAGAPASQRNAVLQYQEMIQDSEFSFLEKVFEKS